MDFTNTHSIDLCVGNDIGKLPPTRADFTASIPTTPLTTPLTDAAIATAITTAITTTLPAAISTPRPTLCVPTARRISTTAPAAPQRDTARAQVPGGLWGEHKKEAEQYEDSADAGPGRRELIVDDPLHDKR